MKTLDENTINDLADEDQVKSRARALFRSACENADSYHVLRLGLARRKALQARAAHSAARLWAPLAGGAVACCALLIGVVLMRPMTHIAPGTGATTSIPTAMLSSEATEDIPVIASNQMDMVQDLDFYRWLATQPANAATPRNAQ
ncbi:MAG: hypothetical protein JSR56_09725 [Proteobacteria bacterium]|nr:hypothetical protein [Pseudomonadota bacterium]